MAGTTIDITKVNGVRIRMVHLAFPALAPRARQSTLFLPSALLTASPAAVIQESANRQKKGTSKRTDREQVMHFVSDTKLLQTGGSPGSRHREILPAPCTAMGQDLSLGGDLKPGLSSTFPSGRDFVTAFFFMACHLFSAFPLPGVKAFPNGFQLKGVTLMKRISSFALLFLAALIAVPAARAQS